MDWEENRYWNYNGLDDQFIIDFDLLVGKITRCSDYRIFALGEFRYSNYLRTKRRVKTLRTHKTGFLCCLKWYSRHDPKARKIQEVELMWLYLKPKKNMYSVQFFFSENCRRTHRKVKKLMRLLDILSSQKIDRESSKDLGKLTEQKNNKLHMALGAKEYREKHGKDIIIDAKKVLEQKYDARVEELNISIAKWKTLRVTNPESFDDCEKLIKQGNKDMEKLTDKYNDKIKSLDLNLSVVEDPDLQHHIFKTEVQEAINEFDSSVKKLDSLKLYKSEYSKAALTMKADDILAMAFGHDSSSNGEVAGPQVEIEGPVYGPDSVEQTEEPKPKGKGKKSKAPKLATIS